VRDPVIIQRPRRQPDVMRTCAWICAKPVSRRPRNSYSDAPRIEASPGSRSDRKGVQSDSRRSKARLVVAQELNPEQPAGLLQMSRETVQTCLSQVLQNHHAPSERTGASFRVVGQIMRSRIRLSRRVGPPAMLDEPIVAAALCLRLVLRTNNCHPHHNPPGT
jgi:hypothetical protein